MAWRMLREHPASMIATFVALSFAVTAVTMCGAMLESGLRYHGELQRYAAAPVLVATTNVTTTHGSGEDRESSSEPLAERGHVDPALVNRIAEVPGVRVAVSDVAVPTQVESHDGPIAVEVHPWSAAQLAPFALRAGSAPASRGDAVLDQRIAARLGVRSGDSVRLDLPSGPQSFTVSGVAAAPGTEPDAPTVFTTDAVDRSLSPNADTAGVIGVLPEPGVDTQTLARAVRSVLPPLPERPTGAYPQVFVGADRGVVESPAVGNAREFVIAVSSVFGGMTLLIAALVIAGTVGLSVRQRHRDIALLRAIAATPRQVRRMVVRESATLGVLAAALGVWTGLASAGWLRDQFVSRGIVPSTFHAHLSWLPPLVAAAAALLVAIAAAWVASLRASRIRPTQALSESSVERGGLGIIRTILGLIALGGGIVLSGVSASATGDAAAGVSVATVFTLVVAVALLAPVLIRVATATFGRLLRVVGVTGQLAGANLATSARHLAAVVSSLVLAVALGGSLWFVQTSEEHVAARQIRDGVTADYVVTPAASGISPTVTDSIRNTAGVAAATGVVHSTMYTSHDDVTDYTVQGVDPNGLGRTLNLDVTAGSLDQLRGNTIAIDNLTAQAMHLRVGNQFVGWYGDGSPAQLRVVAVYTRGLAFGALTVPRDVLAAHTTGGLEDAVFVSTAGSKADVASALRGTLGRLSPGSSLVSRGAYAVGLDESLAENAWTNQMITMVLVVYVVIAAVNALVMYALGRRRQFAVLRLAGMTKLQVLRMVRLEQVLLLGIALVLGIAIAAATLIPMVKGITGSATPYIPPAGWVAVIGGTVLLGGLAALLPSRRALGARPVEAIGIRE